MFKIDFFSAIQCAYEYTRRKIAIAFCLYNVYTLPNNHNVTNDVNMMHMQAKIQRWGNSLAIRLTGSARTIPHFTENMPVDIEISETGIHIRPGKVLFKKLPFSETDLLANITPALAHADALASPSPKETEYDTLYPRS